MRARGFTLVEVLIALVIMAVMASMAWQGVDTIARSRAIAQERVEQTLRLNAVLLQWEQDLLALYDNPQSPLPQTIAFDGASARLVRSGEGGVQLVVWSLDDGSWSRWASPPITRVGDLQESWLRSQQFTGQEPGRVPALAGVADWQMYFYQRNAWTNAQSSGDVAPPHEQPGEPPSQPQRASRIELPDGVRIVITLGEGALTRDVRLAAPPQQR